MTSRDGLNHHNHCVGKKLLIVDDEPTSIRVLAETLPPYYQLFSATSGQEALKLAARIQPDLILLDIRMPDMDGYELFRAMQADQFLRTIPIIFVTALTGEEDESIGLALGAVDYITKPFRPAIVRQRISNYLELKQRRDEQLSRVEESLRESEERFRLFMDMSPTVSWIKDDQGRYLYISRTFEHRFNLRSKETYGRRDEQIWPLEIAHELQRNDLAVLTADSPMEFTEKTVNPDGSPCYWLSSKFPFRDSSGNRYIGGVGVNITERNRIQEEVQSSEIRYRALFNNMLHGFAHCRMLYDDQGQPEDFIYLEVNDYFNRLTGWQNVVGKRISEIIPDIREIHPELLEIYGRVAMTGETENFDFEFKPLKIWLTNAAYSITPGYFSITFADISRRKQFEQQLQRKVEEIGILKQQVESENNFLRAEIRDRLEPGEMVGTSPALRAVLAQASQLAKSDITVLLQGETGTGKELLARYLHQQSNRSRQKLFRVSCAAIPFSLMESELFGHEKGAFTGAMERRIGHFELADQATLFLDEIGELPLEAQAKLLRILQEGEFCRVGSPRTIKTDTRIIAATNRNLSEEVQQGRFREDLYYRLSGFPLTIPPLRDRSEDIPLLVWAFVHELGAKMGKNITRISSQEMTALQQHAWPGNIRELRNVIEHALIFSRNETLQFRLPTIPHCGSGGSLTLQEVESQHIIQVLRSTNWRVDGPKGAARLLGLNPNTLHSRMRKLGIHSP